MDEDIDIHSVFSKENWAYKDVNGPDEQGPYGPFKDWTRRLGLDVNKDGDLEKCHLLLCILNFAALHDNKIEDTRDFLGFFWWYVEKIKPLAGYSDTNKRKAAYHDMIFSILLITDFLFIELFSPAGDIYSVRLFPHNAKISSYMKIKMRLERLYAGTGRDFFKYPDLKELDEAFYRGLDDPEIYARYIYEFSPDELTAAGIMEARAPEKLILIKMPEGQKIILPPEYLNQLARLTFLKIQQSFYNPDDSLKNQESLSAVIEKVNKKNNSKYNIDQALCLLKDYDSLAIEHDFWKNFLGAMNIPGSTRQYAHILGAVLPDKIGADMLEDDGKKGVEISEEDISKFYDALCEVKTADYTFSSFIEIFPRFPKQFFEKALEVLIKNRKISRIRDKANVSHFIVSKNVFIIFVHYIEQIRISLLKVYAREFNENNIHNAEEFRLDIERRMFEDYPVFYQLYKSGDFSKYVYNMLEKTGTADSEKYKKILFARGASGGAGPGMFLQAERLLNMDYGQFIKKETEVPAAQEAPQSGQVGRFFSKMSRNISSKLSNAMDKDLEKKRIPGLNIEKKAPAAVKEPVKEKENDPEDNLRAIAGNIIEEFMGSKQMPLEDAVQNLMAAWNYPITSSSDEINSIKKENFQKITALINSKTGDLDPGNIDRTRIEERSAEISISGEAVEILNNIVRTDSTPEIFRRYIALRIIALLIRK